MQPEAENAWLRAALAAKAQVVEDLRAEIAAQHERINRVVAEVLAMAEAAGIEIDVSALE